MAPLRHDARRWCRRLTRREVTTLVSPFIDTSAINKVFISHSANDDPFAMRVRDLVTARLRERGYQVLVDTDALVVGEDWNPQLYRWLEQCHAAVVLLSRKALDSAWVRREINILLWRRARNPGLLVVPALLAINATAVNEAKLSELEPVQAARCAGTSDEDAERLAEVITSRFTVTVPVLGDDPLRNWLRRVARALHTVPVAQRDVLQRAAHHFDMPADLPVEWNQEDACRLLAAQFLSTGLSGRRLEHALWAVAESLDRGPFEKLQVDTLPAWVDGEAARRVLPPCRGVEPVRMTVFLDVNNLDLASDYVARAMCRELPHFNYVELEAPPVGEAAVEEVLQACRAAVRRMLSLDDGEQLSPAIERQEDKAHYLLLHPGQAPAAAVAQAVAALHRECPWLVVVALGANGRITPALLEAAGLDHVVVVEPTLPPGDEQRAKQLRNAVATMAIRVFG